MPVVPMTLDHPRSNYWTLIKPRQTALLTLTGLAGYCSAQPSLAGWPIWLSLVGSLFLTISGCTLINMVFDRDIDARMPRTARRPIPAGLVTPAAGLSIGAGLASLGVLWAFSLSSVYAVLVIGGGMIDIFLYTLWLKRLTAWSILWGGLAGGMPILAGRVLAVGNLDTGGLLMTLAVVMWIPTHNLSLAIIFAEDYQQACLPTLYSVYGPKTAQRASIFASLLTGLAMTAVFVYSTPSLWVLTLLSIMDAGLLYLGFSAWRNPSPIIATRLYHYSTLYMLFSMLLLVLGTYL